MRLIIKSREEIDSEIANLISRIVNSKSNCVLGLPTGSTPLGIYRKLIDMTWEDQISFKNVTTINLDEYVGLTGDDKQSYRYFMDENLFNHIDIKKENTFVPCGIDDLQENIDAYEKLIIDKGGIDFQLLGIGRNGHIAFNEPGTSFESITHVVELSYQTKIDNSRFFDDSRVPSYALTMGLATIMKAKKIVLVAFGEQKAEAIRQLIEENPCEKIPASILKYHLDCTIYVDQAAASKLNRL